MKPFVLISFLLLENPVLAQTHVANNCNNFIDIKVEVEKIEPESKAEQEKDRGYLY